MTHDDGHRANTSPEQGHTLPAGPRSYVLRFGATLYETLIGQRAFSGESAVQTITGWSGRIRPRSPKQSHQGPKSIVSAASERNRQSAFKRPPISLIPCVPERLVHADPAVPPVTPPNPVAQHRPGAHSPFLPSPPQARQGGSFPTWTLARRSGILPDPRARSQKF
jgi:hypothetical protein